MNVRRIKVTTYLIIGNGVAGNSAAEAIRTIDTEGKILMFSKEKIPFYYVPALPEYISGGKELKRIIIHDEKWYEKNRIDLYLTAEIEKVDPTLKTVSTRNGATYTYDRLLLATGGVSFIPPIKGAHSEGVYTLRTFTDAEVIREKARQSKRLVLIGGGLLGLEAGNALRRLGIEVTVVEFFPRLLPRQMDVTGASLLQKQMEGMGFRFRLGALTREIIRRNGTLSVLLESGETLDTEMVLVSAGVRPELTLAKSLGLEIDKGVSVDDSMKTSIDGIYAAGDLTEHRGRLYGIWPAAMEQGRVAGSAMAGKDAHYKGTVPANTLKVVGIDLMAVGEIDPEGKMESISSKNETKNTYRKLVLKDNVITGAILFGDVRGSEEIQNAIKTKLDITSMRDDLADEKFDFARLRR